MTSNKDGGEAVSRKRRAANVALRDAAADTEEAVRKVIDAQQAAIAALMAERDRERAAIDALQAERDRERARAEAILSSTSWKLTAPIRFAKTLGKVLRHGRQATASAPEDAVPCPSTATPPGIYRAWIAESEGLLRIAAIDEPAVDILFSILLPVAGHGEDAGFAATLASLQGQDHGAWQLIAVPFAGHDHHAWASAALRLADAEPRLLLADAAPSRGAALRNAVALASGAFVLPLQSGDVLAPGALARFAGCFGGDPALEILYADEDSLSDGERCRPQLKPSWSPDLLAACDYFGRPTAMRRSAVEAVGSFAVDLGAASEWDLHLRLAGPDMDRARTPRIGRITEILCHRASGPAGHAAPGDQASADYRQALARHWGRQGIMAQVVTQPDGTQHASWGLPHAPLVSAIVLNKDHAALLRECLDGLLARTAYPAVEIIIVDNASTDTDTLALYGEIEMAGARIVDFKEAFNYSRACNIGAAAATGDMLLFLNNDLEMIEPGWLDEMVKVGGRPGVGVVGARLIYPNGDLQHGGVVLGLQDLCAHPFHNTPISEAGEWGVFGNSSVCRNYIAVTGACMLMHRTVFDRVGGFDESFVLAFSDVKLGIDTWRAGYRNVYAPQAILVHHEGCTRGIETPRADQAALAAAILSAAIVDDPYFHPAISAHATAPVLRFPGWPSAEENLRASIARLDAPAPAAAMDLFDDSSLVAAADQALHDLLWQPQAPAAVVDCRSTARLIIDLIRSRPDIRAAFPVALSEGKHGAFAKWLKSEGAVRIGMPDEAACWIDAAFDEDFAARARQVVLYDDALRSSEPLFLLPPGRAAAARVLFAAAAGGTLDLLEVWWMLLACAEAPGSELILTWQLTPDWQRAHPAGITVFGCDGLSAWIRRRSDADEDWLDPAGWPMTLPPAEQIRMAYLGNDAWRARFPHCYEDRAAFREFLGFLRSDDARLTLRARRWVASLDPNALIPSLDTAGINIFGHFSYPSGLRTSVNAIVGSLHVAGVATSLRDVRVHLSTDEPGHDRYVGSALFDTTLIHIQPEPLFDQLLRRSGLADRTPHPYRIGYWYWEFDTIPPNWDDAALQCQELWAATNFVAQGLRARYNLPVHVLPPGLELPSFQRHSRQYFGLAENSFVFNFTFHMASVFERKNPLALISAFRLAFGRSDDAQLVIKVTCGGNYPHATALLRSAAEGLNVQIIDAGYSHAEILALMAASDAYVSLHRSEGFGLTMAEAMLLGKPTIATGYSGNLDFMHDGNSLLVRHRVVELERDVPPYTAGLQWGDPDVEHAAELMRRLYLERDYGRELGAIARTDLTARFSLAHAGRAMADRLHNIGRASQRNPTSASILIKQASLS